MRFSLAVLLFVAAIVLPGCAQQNPCGDDKPCTTPSQWTGFVFSLDRDRDEESFTLLSYDAINKRIFTNTSARMERVFSANIEILDLFNKEIRYEDNLQTKECRTEQLRTGDFRPIGVPDNATCIAKFVLGGPGGITVLTWVGEIKLETDTIYYELDVTESGCIPVADRVADRDRKVQIQRTFIDIVSGLPYPGVFDVPKDCSS